MDNSQNDILTRIADILDVIAMGQSTLIKIMEEWWWFIENYSKRDQLAFPYVMWKNNRKIDDYSIDNLKPKYKEFCIFLHFKDRLL